MANNHQRLHAIFIPYPLQGHVIPSIHLAIKLASRGFTISFINTQFIHHQISKAQPDTIGDNIFAEAHKSGLDIRYYTVSDGLPLGFDRSINHDQFMASLLHVFSAHIEELIRKIIIKSSSNSIQPVNCLIADTFFVWPSMISKKLGLPYVSFWTEPALVYSLYYHMDLLRKNGHFGSNDNREDTINYIPGVPAIEPTDLMSYLQDTDLSTVVHEIIFKAFDDAKGADFIICNTVQELEPETISALQVDKPFYAIGPIFPTGFTKSNVATSLWVESDCTQWLDSKPNGSVLYVSFGSYAHVSKNDLTEIAHGLLLSKVNFVFVLRPDVVSSDEPDPLPEGFLEESKDRGIIVQWCCQIAVLSHPAVGGFLTHCGWNSILESIWCGVPILCFPLLTDQFTNRKLVVDDWRIGLDIDSRKLIARKEVSAKINRLMEDKLGQEFRKEIKEVKKALQNASKDDGSSEKNFNQFVKDLTVLIGQKSGTQLV
ncbi:UDP-glucuronosyl/UDP-glucosyltransferase [Macleaya cordata]|uniref:Glycosyltransferase n=1 Tax=Macleaya cordata TaxID=56857 RepID=A0A200R5Q0_MACCD|nr:UDP-glucuronosyl/UDP-glucosyltransferase [Macleaya cordata]